jgi:hypothetical protein
MILPGLGARSADADWLAQPGEPATITARHTARSRLIMGSILIRGDPTFSLNSEIAQCRFYNSSVPVL